MKEKNKSKEHNISMFSKCLGSTQCAIIKLFIHFELVFVILVQVLVILLCFCHFIIFFF